MPDTPTLDTDRETASSASLNPQEEDSLPLPQLDSLPALSDTLKKKRSHGSLPPLPSSTAPCTPEPFPPSEPTLHVRPPWQADKEATHCPGCRESFTLLRRKHHCRACGQIFCNDCSPHRLSMVNLGYYDPQRVCVECFKKVKKSTSLPPMSRPRAAHFEDPQAPIQRSPAVLFAPPASPIVPQEELPPTSPSHSHKLCYFDFTMSIDGKNYPNIQVSVSHDRILITAFETMPPLRTLFYQDILAVKKSSRSPNITVILWFPWTGPKENRARCYRKVLATHTSSQDASKFRETVTQFMIRASPQGHLRCKERSYKKLLVMVNPKSGSGNAWKIYCQMEWILKAADIQCDSVYLEGSRHAYEILKGSSLKEYFAIVSVSGNSVVHYITNALIEMDITLPVFSIPAGHSAGIVSSVIAESTPLAATYSIAKGFRRYVDLVRVNIDDASVCYGTLLVTWGAIADADLKTSSFRWLGTLRYQLGAIATMTNVPLVPLKISYLPAEDQTMTFCTGEGCQRCIQGTQSAQALSATGKPYALPSQEEGGWKTVEGDFFLVNAMMMADATYHHRFAPYAHPSDGYIDLTMVKHVSRARLVELYCTLKNGSFVDHTNYNSNLDDTLIYVKVKAFKVTGTHPFMVDGVPYSHASQVTCDVLPSRGLLGS